jgi:DNA polymerase
MGAAKFMGECDKMGAALDPVPPDRWLLDRSKKFVLLNVAGIDYRDPQNADLVSKFLAANAVVKQWRAANPKITALWAALQAELETAATNREKVHYFRLPSGRRKGFFNPHFRIEPKVNIDPDTGKKEQILRKQLFAQTIMGGDFESLHGGVITENLVQAIARDVMFWGALDCVKHDPEFHYIGNIYDEVISEVPDAKAELADRLIPEFLCRGSALSWAKGLPLEVEGGIKEKYEK